MLGLARHLPLIYRSVFLSFAERGLARPLLAEAARHGFEAVELRHNAGQWRRAVREVTDHLRRVRADVLLCHGYKPDIIGWRAARVAGVPVVAVSHGWTAATLKVRLNETVDRRVLRWMDAVVGVSAAQAARVRRAGVPSERVLVIRNAVADEAFAMPAAASRAELLDLFASPPRRLVGAAGRLSREKGFDQLVEAAALVAAADPGVGFIVFGDGPQRQALHEQISCRGLRGHFVLAGFRADVGRLLPNLDLVALPSRTEGLPVILLEALAAGVPVVATAVGGIPEVIDNGRNGFLVPKDNPRALADCIQRVLHDESRRRALGEAGRLKMRAEFSFRVQSEHYQQLFERLWRVRQSCDLSKSVEPACPS